MRAGEMLAPLRYRPFRLLASGRLIAMFGNAMAPIALAFAVLDLTGSASDLGLVIAARSIMNVLFLLIGGVIADRLPRQLVMVVSSLLAAVTQGAVATLVLTGRATIPLLMLLGAVNGIVAAFSLPASAAILPQTVPEGIRQQANAINRLGINASMIVGASAGGLLVAAFGAGWGLAVDAGTFLLAAICFALVKIQTVKAAGGRNVLADLREGWREFIGRTWLWVVVVGFGVLNAAFVAGLFVLGPAIADQTVGRRMWGLVLAAQTLGMVLGGLVALRVRLRHPLRVGVACMLGEVLFLGTLGIAPHPVTLILAGVLAGIAVEQFGVAWETTMQQEIPADRLARVYSYDMLGSLVAVPVGQVAAGPVAHLVGLRPAVLLCGGLTALAVLGMLASRDVRQLRRRTVVAEDESDPKLSEIST